MKNHLLLFSAILFIFQLNVNSQTLESNFHKNPKNFRPTHLQKGVNNKKHKSLSKDFTKLSKNNNSSNLPNFQELPFQSPYLSSYEAAPITLSNGDIIILYTTIRLH